MKRESFRGRPPAGGALCRQRIATIVAQVFAVILLLGTSGIAEAVQYNCSDYPLINGFHVIDGEVPTTPPFPPSSPAPDNIKIDVNCRIQNYPQGYPGGFNTNFSFDNNDPTPYLVIFDNVFHTGNMSCNTVAEHKIWFTNGSSSKILGGSCQNLLIPVEMIDKRALEGPGGNEITSATVGVPFTYNLTIPVLFDAGSGTVINGEGSLNDVHDISVRDDISSAALGVDLTYLGHTVTRESNGAPVAHNFSNVGGLLTFDNFQPNILPAGEQIIIEIEVVLEDTPLNAPGSAFINVAEWEFGRFIDGIFYDPLPGENGRAELVTISEPELVLDKNTDATAINFTDSPSYTVDVQNVGGFDAWGITVEDELPTGMCLTDPSASVVASVLATDGSTVVRTLDPLAGDFVVSYDAGTCLLTVTLNDSAGAIAPDQHLLISYDSQLDPIGSPDEASDGDTLTNVAAATQWFNDSSANASRVEFTAPRSDGTPGVTDNQDAESVTAGLSGYYFEKTVVNLVTGASPAFTAASGDRLRYRLRLFNLDQVINDISISDLIDVAGLDASSLVITSCPALATCSFDAGTGLLSVDGNPVLDAAAGTDLMVEYEVDVLGGLADGTLISNQADLSATDGLGDPFLTQSDDPNVNGVSDPEVDGDEDPTVVQVVAPGPLSKANPAQSEVAIGEQFTYRVTVPETPDASPLFDVRILDNLAASGVDLEFVGATVVSGGSWSLTNTGTASDLVIEDLSTGIDIPAGGQAVIDITVELLNTVNNQSGDAFSNTASYTFNRANGNPALQVSGPAGPNDTTPPLTVVEPDLAISKTVANVTAGKSPTDPASGGDLLEYTLTMPNSGTSAANDATITDTLPAGLTLVPGSASATIGGVSVAGFVAAPTDAGSGVLIWGDDNGDGSLDIPVGQSLELTYRVNVADASIASFDNSAVVEWTSLQGDSNAERSGAGCPNITQPDDYCAGPATATITTVDTNALAKTVVSDSWDDAVSTASDSLLRVGDTVVYRLALNLREGLTANVAVSDSLPAGLEFDSMVAINGDASAPFSAVAPFSHGDIAAPAVAGNQITWTIGDITNAINNDTSDDIFIIEYQARVVTDTLAHVATTTLTNDASFSYDNGIVLNDSANIEVRQPVLVTLTKTDDLGNSYPDSTSPLQVDLASDIMNFRLQACNDSGSTAPAYSLQLVDTLAAELDETSITTPLVTVNGAAQADGVDYTYTPPAGPGGTLTFDFVTPVNPGQCALVEYSIGFQDGVAPNQLWNNSVTAAEYWSLPAAAGQQYAALGPAEFWMTNQTVDPLPLKNLVSPASEAVIGETVTYTITIPAINAARSDVMVTDNLPVALVYDSATATVGGNPVALTDNSTPPDQVSLTIADIPAGQEAVVTLVTHVANTVDTNAGDTFNNVASYTYAGYSGTALTSAPSDSLTIVEPLVSLTKAVTPTDPPVSGDVLTYTVDMTADTGATFSDAFDLVLTDTLSLGLAYVPGTATVAGAAVEPDTITGDGINTAQTLTWENIDIPEGTAVQVVYDVEVQNNVTPGQVLANTATATWTSLSGVDANERDGSGGVNDYITSDSTNLGAPDNTTLAKTRIADTFNTAAQDVRVGDRVQFELRIGLQEGSHNDLVLTDVLPTGLTYEDMVSADFFGTAGTATPTVSGQTLTWNLGDVTNPADGDPGNDFLVLVYEVRIENNDVLSQTPASQPLFNSASLDYTVGGVAAPTKTADASVEVLQPELAVAKSASAAGGDTVVVAGETVTYTVDITNNGLAPAYDTVLTDTLPVGMRQSGATTTAMTLVNAGAALPLLAPSYDPGTGVATWDFDNGAADTYTIPVGEILRVEYTVQVDPDVGASLTLINSALVSLYYSFDNDAVPANGADTEREEYGPTGAATSSLTTPGPGALSKVESASTVAVGDQFSYQILVPATPVDTALFDVRITDDLGASAAVLSFVSVDRAPAAPGINSGAWTPTNTGTATQLVIEDTAGGIDIPAGEQIAVDITVEVVDDPANVDGLVFNNSADYTFNRADDDAATQGAGQPGTSGDTTIVEPGLVMTKSGPATMSVGTPDLFTLDVQNTGSGAAWDITLTDHLPNLASGGMCDNAPVITTARVYDTDGSTLLADLAAGTDYVTSFAPSSPGTPCTFIFTGQTAAAALETGQFLRVEYQAELDDATPANSELTNFAGATEWFSADDAFTERRTYSHVLEDVVEDTPDPQDYHTLTSNPPEMTVEKTVAIQNDLNGDGLANPGDSLRYTLTVTNTSQVLLPNFSLRDDVGALHTEVIFEPGSLVMVTVPPGATDNSDANGGTNGAGLVDVQDLSLDVAGSAGDTVTVVFDVTLASPIDNGTVVLNQGSVEAFGSTLQLTDDPNLPGDEDPTRITIASAPVMQVQKVSDDMTGDPAVLAPGDTLLYTITVANIGNENAMGVTLRDAIPEYTTYVTGSTTLNGNSVVDPAAGVSPLEAGMLINAPGNITPGAMDADATAAAENVATITFSVTIDADTLSGTRIVNQGFVNGAGAGGTDFMEQPSDDPATPVANDPTEDIVGALPLLDVQKTVVLANDVNGNNAPDPDDTLLYTFVVTNSSGNPATDVVLTDQIPANTTYVAGSTTLNGAPVADAGGASALANGLPINSSGEPAGSMAGNSSATVTLSVTINAGVAGGTVIRNQGILGSTELPDEPSDADGVDSNGDQPTEIIVGAAQQVSIVKDVTVVGGGIVQAGSVLEYTLQVVNNGLVPATQVVLTDDLTPLAGLATYVPDSARLNGGIAGVDDSTAILVGDYGSAYGDLPVGATATLRFQVRVDDTVPPGTTISNTGEVSWDNDTRSASSTVVVEVGAIPGTATLSGQAWHDANFDNVLDTGENVLPDWTVEIYRNGSLLRTTNTDDNGRFVAAGLPETMGGETYEVRYLAPGATASTATLGLTDSAFTDGLQRITDITAAADDLVQNLNLPIDPNGVVYDAISRQPVPGARVTMVDAGGSAVATSCFDDPAQQGQVTTANGFYKFDLNFSAGSCPGGSDYLIQVTPPASGYEQGVSRLIAPDTSDATAAYDAPTCSGDAVATTSACEVQSSANQPGTSVAAGSPLTGYYLHLTFDNTVLPDDSQIFNNHIPLDPQLGGAVSITKTSSVVNVSRGQFVPYVIRISNTYGLAIPDLVVVDSFPAGFKYVADSARLDDVPVELVREGRQLILRDLDLAADGQHTLKMLFIVGAGVSEGEYVNRAQVFNAVAPRSHAGTTRAASGEASATVRVVPDPDFDCTDVIGKIFDDANQNGYQDEGEAGLPGVRAVTARGLLVTSDEYGRFHITCAVVPDENRGSNFILKVDDRTLPTGYRLTTENPLVRRATRGKMIKFNFGAALHRVVRLDLANGVFEPDSTQMRLQWQSRVPLLMEELGTDPSILRLAYMAENESKRLVEKRLKAMKRMIAEQWAEMGNPYELTIETEVFWRTGAPPERSSK